ncbi:hypothetical protein J7L70_07570 [Candidatus Bathyarchaeota archaeon]|nr:hypothetical protein [Candidatus Bathyarchaeota archaeon]
MITLVLVAVGSMKGKVFDPRTLALFVIMVSMFTAPGGFLSTSWPPAMRLFMAAAPAYSPSSYVDALMPVMPSYLFIPIETVDEVKALNQPYPYAFVDWSIWAIPITVHTLFLIAYFLSMFSIASFWAKTLIEVEKLPFPIAQPSIFFIGEATKVEEGKVRLFDLKQRSSRSFWVGFPIGGFFAIVVAVFSYYNVNPPMPWGDQWMLDLRPLLARYLPGAYLDFRPLFSVSFIALGYLIPLEILATTVVWFLFWYDFVAPLGVIAGVFPSDANWDTIGWDHCLIPYRMISLVGVPLAMAIAPIVFYRSQIWEGLRSILGGSSHVEKPGDLPVRWVFALFVISSLLLTCISISFGTHPLIAFLIVVVALMFQTGNMRFFAEGWPFTHRYWGRYLRSWMMTLGTGIGLYPSNPFDSSVIAGQNLTIALMDNFWSQFHIGYAHASLMFYKIGHDLGVSYRDLFKYMLTALVLGCIISNVSVLVFTHIYGTSVDWGVRSWWRLIAQRTFHWSVFSIYKGVLEPESLTSVWRAVWIAPSIVVVFIIMWLRLRFPWFWLHPIGIFFAWHSWFMGSALIAFIAKWLTLRFSGVRGYERYCVPAVIGYIVGYTMVLSIFRIVCDAIPMKLFGETFLFGG